MSSQTTEKRRSEFRLLRGGASGTGELLRPYREIDCPVVKKDLTSPLLQSYPRADHWLSNRLKDVLEGSAHSYLARDLLGLRAIAIETPKGRGKLKLSTIWVAERARGRGLGTRLLSECQHRWLERGIEEVWITVSPRAMPTVSPLLVANDFRLTAIDADRYGEGRPEAIFTWRPEGMVDSGIWQSVISRLPLAA